MSVTGYKVFNPDWTCRGFKYEVGQTYEMEEKPQLCKCGFHFCEKAVDCFNYYDFNTNNHVAEIIAYGDIANNGGDKSCTNKIEIAREISWNEVLEIVNTGKGCRGYIKINTITESKQIWWNGLSEDEKNEIMSLPNFDVEIFKEITGIDVGV